MQPNEQKQYSQSPTQNLPGYVSPSGADIPEYLRMDPVPASPRKKRKKGIILGIFTVIVIALLGLALYIFTNKSPEANLHNAMYKLLSTKYIHREIVIQRSELDGIVRVVADSDLTDSDRPRTGLTFTYDGFKERATSDNGLLKGEIFTLDSEYFVGRVTETPVVIPGNIKTGTWYKAKTSTPFKDNPDTFGVYEDTNNPVGTFIMGNYPSSKADEIMSLLQKSSIYKIESSSSEPEDGRDTTRYTLSVNYENLSKLVNKVNIDLGTKLKATTLKTTNIVDAVVSNESGRIIKIHEKVKQNDLDVQVETKLSYPDSAKITPPESAKAAVKLTER